MKYLHFLALVFSSTAALGFVVLPTEQQQHVLGVKNSPAGVDEELRLVQLSPTETRWVTEDQKLELKRQGLNFMDITDHQDLVPLSVGRPKFQPGPIPKTPSFQDIIHPILGNLTTTTIETNLREFTSFYTRYYKSDYGRKSSEWLKQRILDTIDTAPGIDVTVFSHSWPQSSLIARIPGRSENTVVIGAHQDSINLFLPSILGAPGADDDGSGTVTILESLRVIATSKQFLELGGFENTLEFHWYSAEEGGLLGSQAIFSSYAAVQKPVVAMLQQDMTGFVRRTHDAGLPESVGVITDFVDSDLTEFIKKVVDEYCDIPWVETKCGYACSDHASASRAGYRSAFVIESEFSLSSDKIHTTEDKMEFLSLDHMLQHAKLTVGLALELAMAKF